MMTDSFSELLNPTLASLDSGWLSIFAASGSIATFIGVIIMVTVWLTGGFRGGN